MTRDYEQFPDNDNGNVLWQMVEDGNDLSHIDTSGITSFPVKAGDTKTKLAFDGVTFLTDEPAKDGEEDYLNEMNSESELNINAGGNEKVQKIIEHAANKVNDTITVT